MSVFEFRLRRRRWRWNVPSKTILVGLHVDARSCILLFSVIVIATTAVRALLDQTAGVSAGVSATTAWTQSLVQADAFVLMISRSHADLLRLLFILVTLDVLRVPKDLNQCGRTALVAVNQSKVAVVCHRFVQMGGKGLSATCLTAVLGRVS